jgi:hypothetical protein
MTNATIAGTTAHIAATGVIKVDGRWVGRIKQTGENRFYAAMEDGRQIGTFSSHRMALAHIIAAAR